MWRIAGLAGFCLAAAAFGAPAQAEIVSKPVIYQVDGKDYEGDFARNTGFGDNQPVVLIVHDWDGLTGYEKRRAEMLAEQGYAAFAVDLYGKGVRPTATEDKKAQTGALYSDRAEMRARLDGAVAALDRLDGIDPDRAVAIGYCFGGAAVLEQARSGAGLDGFVSFHGGLSTPDGQDYSAVTAPVLILHGSQDSVSPMADVAALADALDAAQVDHRMEIYGGAPHAFTEWSGKRYVPAADLASWAALKDFLAENLR